MLRADELVVSELGPPRFNSPLRLSTVQGDGVGNFVGDARVRFQVEVGSHMDAEEDITFERAGPRQKLFFDPANTTAAMVTCGGLSPGLNNVIRSAYIELRFNYGVPRVLGIRNGYMGLSRDSEKPPVELTPQMVEEIHKLGGTILGSSRGPQEPAAAVDFLMEQEVDILFCIGGDGTQRGCHALSAEIRRRGLPIATIGIPKTIDNDIPFVSQSFGYATALAKSQEVLRSAHVEARCAPHGIGLVKLMGRDAGFIAAGAALASQEVNLVLVPEVAFALEGDNGLLATLERRVAERDHAVVVVAEGAGQHLFNESSGVHDASGNRKHHDIGLFLKDKINAHFAAKNTQVNVKYFDPSYFIRSVPANTDDRLLSDGMARNAVHAAMAGRTDTLIGFWSDRYIHVPISTVTSRKKRMETEGDLWTDVLMATGQPRW